MNIKNNSLADHLASITADEIAARFNHLIEIQGEEDGLRQTEIAQMLISKRIPAFVPFLGIEDSELEGEPAQGFRVAATCFATVAIARTEAGDLALERALADIAPDAIADIVDDYMTQYPLFTGLVLGDGSMEQQAALYLTLFSAALVLLAERLDS